MLIGDFKLKGYQIKVSAALRLPGKDISGQTNSTLQAENGIKPKTLTVKLMVQQKNEKWLKELISTAESEDTAGRRTIYDIVDRTASAMNIRQVKFTEAVIVREDEVQKAWSINFTLIEHRSVAEKAQAKRTKGKDKKTSGGTEFDDVLQTLEGTLAQ